MLNQVKSLSSYQKSVLLNQASDALASWDENGSPELEWDGYQHQCNLNNEDESVLVLYKCDCGKLVAELEEVGELGECLCGLNYLGLDDA